MSRMELMDAGRPPCRPIDGRDFARPLVSPQWAWVTVGLLLPAIAISQAFIGEFMAVSNSILPHSNVIPGRLRRGGAGQERR
jgi:hypothetical protein